MQRLVALGFVVSAWQTAVAEVKHGVRRVPAWKVSTTQAGRARLGCCKCAPGRVQRYRHALRGDAPRR